MTITTTSSQNVYSGNASTTVFSYGFKITDEDNLEVIIADADDVQTTLVITTNYTVSSVGNASGGNVTLGDLTSITGAVELPADWTLSIRRVVPITQGTDLASQGSFNQETHEDMFDKLTKITQQQQNELDRAPKTTETSGDSGDTLMATILAHKDAAEAAQTAAETAQTGAETAETNSAASAVTSANEASASAVSAAAALASETTIAAYFTPIATETINAGGVIAHTQVVSTYNQFRRITGNGAVTTSNKPFGVVNTYFTDGMVIKLESQSATNTVIINHNDAQYGCLLNGNWQGGKGGVLELTYNSTLERFIESFRKI